MKIPIPLVLVLYTIVSAEWLEFNGIWYIQSEKLMNFTDAVDYCFQMDTNIAVLTNKTQSEFLINHTVFGWIGLTNYKIHNEMSPIFNESTGNKLRQTYWVAESWRILRGFGDDDMYESKKIPYGFHNSSQHLAIVQKLNGSWEKSNISDKHPVICEWKCNTLSLATDYSKFSQRIGIYHFKGYVNRNSFYEEESMSMYLYFSKQTSNKFWLLNLDIKPGGYTAFARWQGHSIPYYLEHQWEDNPNKHISLQVQCANIDEIFLLHNGTNSSYIATDIKCHGLQSFFNNDTNEYLFLHKKSSEHDLLWCIGDEPCKEIVTLCNSYSTPFLNRLLSDNWDDPNIATHTTTIAKVSASSDIASLSEIYSTTSDNETGSPTYAPFSGKQNLQQNLGIGFGVVLLIAIIIVGVIVFVFIRKRRRLKNKGEEMKLNHDPQYKDYSYACARSPDTNALVINEQNDTCPLYDVADNLEMNNLCINNTTSNSKESPYALETMPKNIKGVCTDNGDFAGYEDVNKEDNAPTKSHMYKPNKMPNLVASISIDSNASVIDNNDTYSMEKSMDEKEEEPDINAYEIVDVVKPKQDEIEDDIYDDVENLKVPEKSSQKPIPAKRRVLSKRNNNPENKPDIIFEPNMDTTIYDDTSIIKQKEKLSATLSNSPKPQKPPRTFEHEILDSTNLASASDIGDKNVIDKIHLDTDNILPPSDNGTSDYVYDNKALSLDSDSDSDSDSSSSDSDSDNDRAPKVPPKTYSSDEESPPAVPPKMSLRLSEKRCSDA